MNKSNRFHVLLVILFMVAISGWARPQKSTDYGVYIDPNSNSYTEFDAIVATGPSSTVVKIAGTQHVIRIEHEGQMIVDINSDGKITYGKDYTPDKAAKSFWIALASMSKQYPVCPKETHEQK